MPSTKFKKRNLARYKKTYPFVQRSPRWGLVSDKDVIIEIADVQFENENMVEYFFAEVYAQIPIVTATVKEPDPVSDGLPDSDGGAFDSASVAVMIEYLDVEKVRIVTSEKITGSVQLHVIFIREY